MTTNFCETCGHQFSDICGGCESLEGVPIKYEQKKLGLEIIDTLKNIRVLVNAGCNERGCCLSGSTCKGIVSWIDEVILYVMEKER